MYKILVTLPSDRDFAGQLTLQDEAGRNLLGPFPVAGRSDDAAAAKHDNPARNPLLPYGDTPTGQYRVAKTLLPGQDTALEGKTYGASGVLVLEPMTGQAALADAHGRFRLLIQGGPPTSEGNLCATSGSLRLTEADQRVLMQAVQPLDRVICECVESPQAQRSQWIAPNVGSEENDPPLAVNLGVSAVTPVYGAGQPAPLAPTVSWFVPTTVAGLGAGRGMLAMDGGGAYDPEPGGAFPVPSRSKTPFSWRKLLERWRRRRVD